jgi:hypothetical protein
MPRLDLIVASSWVGLLALVLVARAAASWLKYRRAIRIARDAERLEAATRPMASVISLAQRAPRPVTPVAPTPRPSTPDVAARSREEGA